MGLHVIIAPLERLGYCLFASMKIFVPVFDAFSCFWLFSYFCCRSTNSFWWSVLSGSDRFCKDVACHLCTKFENFLNHNCVWWSFNHAIYKHRFPPHVVSTALIFFVVHVSGWTDTRHWITCLARCGWKRWRCCAVCKHVFRSVQ